MFRSFFFAGFEGTVGWNRHHQWIDQVISTQHDLHVEADYRRLREAGLWAAREAVRWPLVDQRHGYDFRSLDPFIAASERHDIDVVWDLFHYGYPLDLDPFAPAFVTRFAAYCHAVASYLVRRVSRPLYFSPVNEPSYLAWAAGEAARFAPHRRNCGRELKIALATAAIAGIQALREVAPAARIINIDPICNVVPPQGREDRVGDAADFNFNAVFEAWDILSGRLYPELGGSPQHLDVVGVNYYWTNEWEMGREEEPLPDDDPRRVPIASLLQRVYDRYGCEILITETAQVGEKRADWIRCIAHESEQALAAGVPLRGVCLYPILGMPEWHDPGVWVRMGLWDLRRNGDTLERVAYEPALDALREVQHVGRHADPLLRFARAAARRSERE